MSSTEVMLLRAEIERFRRERLEPLLRVRAAEREQLRDITHGQYLAANTPIGYK